ncbi:MAG TPA: hypothetical protein VF868_00995 [Bacteroidia bacterium]
METLLLKMMLSWAIMIIGFVALFAGCNSPRTESNAIGSESNEQADTLTPPDNTRTDGIKQKSMADTIASDH